MTEVTFEVSRSLSPRRRLRVPIGQIQGVRLGKESVVIDGVSPHDSLTTDLPTQVAEYALRFLDRNYIYRPDQPYREDFPFNCITFAGIAVFGSISQAVRMKLCHSRHRPVTGQYRMPDPTEYALLRPGVMYGLVGQRDDSLYHAMIGLAVPDRHLSVMGYCGDYTVDSTVERMEHFGNLGAPVHLVRFDERPALLDEPQ